MFFFLDLESFMYWSIFSFLFYLLFSFSSIFFFILLSHSFFLFFLPERNKTFFFIFTHPPPRPPLSLSLFLLPRFLYFFLLFAYVTKSIKQRFSSSLNRLVNPNKEGLSSFGTMSQYWSSYWDLKSLHEHTCWTGD